MPQLRICWHLRSLNQCSPRHFEGRLPHKAKRAGYELIFLDAPHQLPVREGDDVPLRTWYLRSISKGGCSSVLPHSLEQSLKIIERLWRDEGNFVGVLGFSQGGAIATVLASLPNRYSGLKFVVAIGAPDNLSKSPDDYVIQGGIPAEVMSLHVMGQSDRAVSMDSSRSLSRHYDSPTILEHPKGHMVPSKATALDFMINFMMKSVDKSVHLDSSAIISDSEYVLYLPSKEDACIEELNGLTNSAYICSSSEVATAQADELEALLAIFPNEITSISPKYPDSYPLTKGSECISFLSKVPCAAEDLSSDISHIISELHIGFKATPNYPYSQTPQISIHTGNLSLSDFPSSLRTSLMSKLNECLHKYEGEVCAFACLQELQDWAKSGLLMDERSPEYQEWENGLKDECEEDQQVERKNRSGTELGGVHVEGEDERRNIEEDDSLHELVHIATQEAYSAAARIRRNLSSSLHSTTPSTSPPSSSSSSSSSGGGVWNYVVGLIGKPSAGKSTFFNALTRAVFNKEGRNLAEVGAQPFTTIDPNIGEGFYAAPLESSVDKVQQFGSVYGRDSSTGRRLLPVLVKDVAGLVPGAWVGRGKGNKFLSDVTDADVLIHVVDATGNADKDGNIVAEKGSSPIEDCQWIRKGIMWRKSFHTLVIKLLFILSISSIFT